MFSGQGWPYLLVPFIAIAVVLDILGADPIIIFFSSALGVVPTAALMGRATEELAHRAGPGIGGLLNVTFGNAPELIIALFALEKGLQEVVKASIIGSILGNLLLVMGAAFLIGGWGRERNKFVAEAAGAQATMLLLAVVALVLPAMFLLARGGELPQLGEEATNFPSERRAHVVRGRDRPAALLLRRAVVLAEDPPGRVQPRQRGRDARGRLERQEERRSCWPAPASPSA